MQGQQGHKHTLLYSIKTGFWFTFYMYMKSEPFPTVMHEQHDSLQADNSVAVIDDSSDESVLDSV